MREARGARGFTLAESLIASVVLAIAVVGVATTIAASHQQTGSVEQSSAAVAAARQLMEEIAAKPLVAAAADATPGYKGGQANRAMYDTINDYDGYADESPLKTLEGEKLSIGMAKLARKVEVSYPTALFGTTAAAGEFAVVEVSVGDVEGNDCVLRRLVARTARER